jgi:hypothetical protein
LLFGKRAWTPVSGRRLSNSACRCNDTIVCSYEKFIVTVPAFCCDPSMQPEPRSLAQAPSEVAGREDFSYDRHLLLDKAADPRGATARDQFEAFARSVRDALAQRWASTTEMYARRNPKTVYYLSMEFLIGRSLANNVTNLLLEGPAQTTAGRKNLDWLALPETRAALDLR